MRLDRMDNRRHEIVGAARRGADRVERRSPGALVSLGPYATKARDLSGFDLRIDPQHLDLLRLGRGERVDPDHDGLAGVDRQLRPVRRFLDLALDQPLLDCGERAPGGVNPRQQGARPGLDPVGQLLDQVRAGHRIHGVRDA